MSSEENSKSEHLTNSKSNAEKSAQNETNSKNQTRSLSSCKIETDKNSNSSVKANFEDKLTSKMFTYARETVCFVLAVAFTALAALHSS